MNQGNRAGAVLVLGGTAAFIWFFLIKPLSEWGEENRAYSAHIDSLVASAKAEQAAPKTLPPVAEDQGLRLIPESQSPPDPEQDIRNAVAGTILLGEAIRVAKIQRNSPNLEQAACMSRFMHHKPKREEALRAFRALPEGTPGAEELAEAAHIAAWCINCAAGDEERCVEAGRLLAVGNQKLKKVAKGIK